MTLSRACPKCHGDLFPEEDEYHNKSWACLQCGKMVSLGEVKQIIRKEAGRRKYREGLSQIPPKPAVKKGNTRTLRNYYNANKAAILADIEKLGTMAAQEKWGVSACGWKSLEKRWGLVNNEKPELSSSDKLVKQEYLSTPPDVKPAFTLPLLPQFNEAWSGDFKLKWLEVYGELVKSGKVA